MALSAACGTDDFKKISHQGQNVAYTPLKNVSDVVTLSRDNITRATFTNVDLSFADERK